jgi:hypothetical protein
MARVLKAIGLVATLMLASSLAQAEIYRWVDKDGKVQYSDNPPPSANVEKRKLIDNKVEADQNNFETKRAMQIAPITLFVAESCTEVCDQARKLLKGRKAPFSETMIKTQADKDALAQLTGVKEPRVPSLTVGRKAFEGFEAGGWNAALDAVGYS